MMFHDDAGHRPFDCLAGRSCCVVVCVLVSGYEEI